MEQIDRRILDLLTREGRISYTELGQRTGLSTSAVHQRVRRLEERGVIRGYRAQVDPAALGLGLTAFIALTPLDPSTVDDIPAQLTPIEEIEACHSIAGAQSYLVKVRVCGPAELEELITRIRTTGKAATTTTVVLSTPYEDRPPAEGHDLRPTPPA